MSNLHITDGSQMRHELVTLQLTLQYSLAFYISFKIERKRNISTMISQPVDMTLSLTQSIICSGFNLTFQPHQHSLAGLLLHGTPSTPFPAYGMPLFIHLWIHSFFHSSMSLFMVCVECERLGQLLQRLYTPMGNYYKHRISVSLHNFHRLIFCFFFPNILWRLF